jgi:hypothetical protein
MVIKSTAIDAPWRSILQLLPYSYPWCVGCDMDCRDIEASQCEGCLEKCLGCLSKKCSERELRYDLDISPVKL